MVPLKWCWLASTNINHQLPITKLLISFCRERACKGTKKSAENEDSSNYSELYDSSSDSDIEVLSDRIKPGRPKSTRGNKQEPKHQNSVHNHHASRASLTTRATSTSVDMSEDADSITSVNGDDFSNVVQPTPQPDKKRSIFTRRQHRPPNDSFDHLEDYTNALESLSRAQTRPNKSSSTSNHQWGKTVGTRGRTDTALAHKSADIQYEMSPLVKKKKQKLKRVMSMSSDSE